MILFFNSLSRPLHLAVIHENFGLTQYLVKLIVGVNMNLDIANNMRQVRHPYNDDRSNYDLHFLMCTCMLTSPSSYWHLLVK